jgi:hypothetical protein
MDAKEIREFVQKESSGTSDVRLTNYLLAEIAAQLAELNRLKIIELEDRFE